MNGCAQCYSLYAKPPLSLRDISPKGGDTNLKAFAKPYKVSPPKALPYGEGGAERREGYFKRMTLELAAVPLVKGTAAFARPEIGFILSG